MTTTLQQPSLLNDSPPAHQVAKLNRALQHGCSSDWIMERLNGIAPRHALTDALKKAVEYVDPAGNQSSFLDKKLGKGQTPEGKFIEAETSYIYGKLGIGREARKAIKNGIKRDHFDAAQLHAVGLAEQHDAKIWEKCVKDQWTREKAKQARTEMLNRLASVQQFMQELTGEAA
ncbi:MAG: hypothetical protein IPL99_12150 [Candidatus Competibacteraceae bacterium]|nr:hypothetical protein [Candidatus Competibacteraceae bacterium]